MPDEPRQQSWWQTIPGILTAIAAVLTAVTGLIVVLRSNDQPKVTTVAPPATPAATQQAPTAPQPRLYPEETVRELLTAWKQGHRDAALKVAESDAVDKLFSASSLDVNSKDLTCYVVGEDQRDCQVSYKNGNLVFRLREKDHGWRVESVKY